MRSGFARLHPLVDLTFFVLVLAFAMFLSHPAVQLAGLVCAALFALRCTGRGFGRRMAMLLPLMLLEDLVKPVSLTLRLYGNIFGEETVTSSFFNLVPIGLPVVMQMLSVLMGLVQALVFALLTGIYIKEALPEEEEHL